MSLKVGDMVSYVNEDLEGKVLSISGKVLLILDQDGFEREVLQTEVVKKKDFLDSSPSIILKQTDNFKPKPSKKAKRDEPEIIDLHFHEIYHSDKGLSNFQKLSIQLDYAVSKIDSAIRFRKKHIVFIHGKGEGVLKSELRSLIKGRDDCYYQDADWRKFGEGATTVFIRYK